MATKSNEVLRIFLWSFLVVAAVSGGIFSISVWLRKSTPQASFREQLAEQNRQADVASQLRAAEIGDYAKMLDGTMLGVWLATTDSDGIPLVVLCGFGNSCTIYDSIPISLAAKRVERIIKLDGPEKQVLAAAKKFMRQY